MNKFIDHVIFCLKWKKKITAIQCLVLCACSMFICSVVVVEIYFTMPVFFFCVSPYGIFQRFYFRFIRCPIIHHDSLEQLIGNWNSFVFTCIFFSISIIVWQCFYIAVSHIHISLCFIYAHWTFHRVKWLEIVNSFIARLNNCGFGIHKKNCLS